MHRFFTPFDAPADQPAILTGDQARQIARVLRLRAGERITLFDGSGRERSVRLEQVSANRVVAHVETEQRPTVEARLQLTLMQAVLKGEAMDLALQRATEAGVAALRPIMAERSVPRAADDAKLGRWQRIAQEAAEQSGRVVVPTIYPAMSLSQALADIADTPLLALWEEERTVSLAAALTTLPSPLTRLALLIGPEGGLTATEIGQASAAGGRVASLGPRILRAGTAGLIAIAAILFAAGELGDPA
jgi:16S rRNA (uracil1498-N3)-methyltransferase